MAEKMNQTGSSFDKPVLRLCFNAIQQNADGFFQAFLVTGLLFPQEMFITGEQSVCQSENGVDEDGDESQWLFLRPEAVISHGFEQELRVPVQNAMNRGRIIVRLRDVRIAAGEPSGCKIQ